MPEPIMLEHHELTVPDELPHWVLLQHDVVALREIVEQLATAGEESGGDTPPAHLGLLVESSDATLGVVRQLAEAAGGMHTGDSEDLPMRPMILLQCAEIDIADAIAVRQKKIPIVADILTDLRNPGPRHRAQSRISERDLPPGIGVNVSKPRRLGRPEHEREVVRVGLVVQEEVFDRVAFVPEAQDELLVSPGGVVLHDVPKDRQPADRNHWLGDVIGDVANPRPEATRENDGLHLMWVRATSV